MSKIKPLIFRLFIIILIVLNFIFKIEDHIPDFFNYVIILLIILIIHNIFKTKMKFNLIKENELRIKNSNDKYFEISPIITGLMICLISIINFLLKNTDKFSIFLFFILGCVIIISGKMITQNAFIKYENSKLLFENGETNKIIDIDQIIDFEINENEIIIFKYNSKFSFQHLDLSEEEIERSRLFLKKYIL